MLRTRRYVSGNRTTRHAGSGLIRLISGLVILLLSIGVFWFFSPNPTTAPKQALNRAVAPSLAASDQTNGDDGHIKDVLIDYARAMLSDDEDERNSFLTRAFVEPSELNNPPLPHASSVELGQPEITYVTPISARVAFSQIIRTRKGIRPSYERLLFAQADDGAWKIAKRASQPKMVSGNVAPRLTDRSFIFIKSDDERDTDLATIRQLLQDWTDARSDADIESLVLAYADQFWTTQDTTKKQWMAQHRDELSTPKAITTSNINIVFPQQTSANVTLNQGIETETRQAYMDTALALIFTERGWKITEEVSETITERELVPAMEPSLTQLQKVLSPVLEHQTEIKSTSIEEQPQPKRDEPPKIDEHVQQITDLVRGWAYAWSSKDADSYLAFYSPQFKPSNGISRERWQRLRRARLTRPKTIKVVIEDLRIAKRGDKSAVVTFVQLYESDLYRDETRKELLMEHHNERWKIVQEGSAPR